MKLYYLTTLFFLVTMACKTPETLAKQATPLELKIQEFTKNACPNGASVQEYLFQGKPVFVFNKGNCGADIPQEVVDADAKRMGLLGGIIGNMKINGEDFSKATLVREVWKQ